MADTKPTPSPAINRPGTSRAMLVDATWSATPTLKTMQPRMMVVRRPSRSAMSPATSAPKKVPADRMEVMRDFSHVWYR